MQRFEFEDIDGTRGSIDEEFRVDYAGRFREDVTAIVEEVEATYRDPPPERAMLEVYCACPIVKAEKWGAGSRR